MKAAPFWVCLCALVAASRMLHAPILWPDEDYHLAAAVQVLHGKIPYLDFWYDKPPLNLAFYLLFGARTGMVLRLADAAFVCLCCALGYRLAAGFWSAREGFVAAGAVAFFEIFYLPSGIIPLEPDTLLIAPEVLAVFWAWKRRPVLAGIAAGIAFQLSPKGVFTLASAALFAPAEIPLLFAGFLLPSAVLLGILAVLGAFPGYVEQVWRWGFLYAGSSRAEGDLWRVAGWLGFHAALVLGAGWYWWRDRDKLTGKTAGWAAISLASAAVGWSFAPRYFMALFPALAIPAARGIAGSRPSVKALVAIALIIPAVRFGPRYLNLENWQDTAMDRESAAVSRLIEARARPGDTIFVWGYRPDVVAYTRLPVSGRIWDSQPATGVPADRHLHDSHSVAEDWARANRQELARTHPAFLVDGLSLYNSGLDMHRYAELSSWLAQYCVAARAGGTIVYSACDR